MYLEYKIWIYCIAFIKYMLAAKTLIDYSNLSSMNECKKNDKIIYKYFKNNMSILEFRLNKIDQTRNYLLSEREHNDFISEKYLTCKYLNYVKTFLVLVSTVTGCVSSLASLVCVSAATTSSTVGIKSCETSIRVLIRKQDRN